MTTWIARPRSRSSQKTAAFTGEGAYHGSTRPRSAPTAPPPVVAEARATTLERYEQTGQTHIEGFEAHFPNHYAVVEQLPVPSQAEIESDQVTFCWTPLEEALAAAGPLTRSVIEAMGRHVSRHKRFIYIDSKLQYFEAGDLPVDSRLWHIDGSIATRGPRAQRLGHDLLHDLRARQAHPDPPRFLAYQSSTHCATQFLVEPVSLHLPELTPDFEAVDRAVRGLASARPSARAIAQPAGSIVAFDGRTLHRAVPATTAGWRLWVRCTATDREIRVDASMLDCYGTVFRPGGATHTSTTTAR